MKFIILTLILFFAAFSFGLPHANEEPSAETYICLGQEYKVSAEEIEKFEKCASKYKTSIKEVIENEKKLKGKEKDEFRKTLSCIYICVDIMDEWINSEGKYNLSLADKYVKTHFPQEIQAELIKDGTDCYNKFAKNLIFVEEKSKCPILLPFSDCLTEVTKKACKIE